MFGRIFFLHHNTKEMFQRKALAVALSMQAQCTAFLPIINHSRRTASAIASARTDDPTFATTTNYQHLKQSRPTRIHAKPLITGDHSQKENLPPNCKIIHFQRHAQGTHNAVYAQWTESTGVPLNLSETDPAKNPLLLPHVIDAPLTQKGVNQCQEQYQANSHNLQGVERIIVSPLVRALQTAQITFGDHITPKEKTVWTAHEGCREELGMLLCNKRRPMSETKVQFPHVDFSLLHQGDEDLIWDEYASKFAVAQRESTEDMSNRVYDFLEGYLRCVPEREVAIVGHSAWLHAMCNAVLDHDEQEKQFDATMFGQAEIRTLALTFSDK